MPRPRVVHMSSVHMPHDPRIYGKECRTLAAAGYEVHLIAPSTTNGSRDGVCIWGVGGSAPSNRARRMTRTVAEVTRLARGLDADVYHFHDPELIPSGLLLA